MRLAILLALSTFLSSIAYAEDGGTFTFLGHKQCAPFEGGLFDPTAMARMVITVEDLQTDCDLNLEYEMDKLTSEHRLEIDNLKIEYDTLSEKYKVLKASTDVQITTLQDTLRRISSDNKWWWFTGGVVAGMAATYGAHRAFNER